MSILKRLIFIFTGGTISMKIDPRMGGAVPVLSPEEILAFVPGLERLTDFEIIDFARMPGPHMTPQKMFELSELLNRQLQRDNIDGAVITHGTDTLEETAYLLDLRLDSPKPVAVVGAMRNSSELGWDGPANLKSAVRVVLDPGSRDKGVFVILNDAMHAASEVTKTHTESMNAFQSPNSGPLGVVDKDRIVWTSMPVRRDSLPGYPIETRVELFKMVAGADDRQLRYSVESGTRGLVIEGTGRGNVPPAVLPGIQYALDRNVPVVLASRCGQGRVLDTYGYVGGGKDLRRRGVCLGGSLPGQKARIKLMVVLGMAQSLPDIQRLMEGGIY
jgi:L-asparaginase